MDHQLFAQLLGNYGEFVGSLAVVLTLGYLAVQARQNAIATRQQSYNDIIRRRNDILRDASSNREVTALFSQGVEGIKFDNVADATRFTFYMIGFFSHVQDCYLQYRSGVVEQSVWEAELRMISASFRRPGLRAWWSVGKQYFVDDFVQFMEDESVPVDLVVWGPETGAWSTGQAFQG